MNWIRRLRGLPDKLSTIVVSNAGAVTIDDAPAEHYRRFLKGEAPDLYRKSVRVQVNKARLALTLAAIERSSID
jgi:hypothetical protein